MDGSQRRDAKDSITRIGESKGPVAPSTTQLNPAPAEPGLSLHEIDQHFNAGARSLQPILAIDICCGGGGWACAARGLPIKIVLAVDFWDAACQTYSLNHPATEVRQADLRSVQVRRKMIEDARAAGVRLVLGGIPCEWLSVYRNLQKVDAAERDAERRTLDSCLEIVRLIDPDWWCLEDVIQIKRELPPFVPHETFDAKHWSAQRRKRCFIGNFPRPARDPVGGSKVLGDMIRPGPYRIGRRLFGRTPQTSRTFSKQTCLGAAMDKKAPTVLSQCSPRDAELAFLDPQVPGGMRNPEWQEMASIQGFPSDYLFYGSPTDVMKQVGRAVPIPLARVILEGIVRDAESRSATGNQKSAIAGGAR